jgi:hypothetical protein
MFVALPTRLSGGSDLDENQWRVLTEPPIQREELTYL